MQREFLRRGALPTAIILFTAGLLAGFFVFFQAKERSGTIFFPPPPMFPPGSAATGAIPPLAVVPPALPPLLKPAPVPAAGLPAPSPVPRIDLVSIDECERIADLSPFYHDRTMQAVRLAQDLRGKGRIGEADLLREIACRPQAIWFVGGDPVALTESVRAFVLDAERLGKIPVLVFYNAPDHTTLRWGSGVAGGDGYLRWIRGAADGIGNAEVWVLLEPDAISLAMNYAAADRDTRLVEIRRAAMTLKSAAPRARVYLDGGHSGWRPVNEQVLSLIAAGLGEADGFFVNVANHRILADELIYAREISARTNGAHFVIDTSRNGGGPVGDLWCNVTGVALGEQPTRNTGDPAADAYIWVKRPGESDGSCNGGPQPGKFWLEYALDLVRTTLERRRAALPRH